MENKERIPILIKNGQAFTVKSFYFYLLLIIAVAGFAGSLIRPFIWGTQIEGRITAVEKIANENRMMILSNQKTIEDIKRYSELTEINLKNLIENKFKMKYITPEKTRKP